MNEAAERLRAEWQPHERVLFGTLLDAALEIERRATVERIRAALGIYATEDILAILDAEAER